VSWLRSQECLPVHPDQTNKFLASRISDSSFCVRCLGSGALGGRSGRLGCVSGFGWGIRRLWIRTQGQSSGAGCDGRLITSCKASPPAAQPQWLTKGWMPPLITGSLLPCPRQSSSAASKGEKFDRVLGWLRAQVSERSPHFGAMEGASSVINGSESGREWDRRWARQRVSVGRRSRINGTVSLRKKSGVLTACFVERATVLAVCVLIRGILPAKRELGGTLG
jgi:hypothetical protein